MRLFRLTWVSAALALALSCSPQGSEGGGNSPTLLTPGGGGAGEAGPGGDNTPVGVESGAGGADPGAGGGAPPPAGGISGAGGSSGAGGAPVEPPPPAPAGQPGALGSACQNNGDCEGGLCIPSMPGGYCSTQCASAEDCPADDNCWNLGGVSACLLSCTDSAQCRTAEGYTCDADATCYAGGGGDDDDEGGGDDDDDRGGGGPPIAGPIGVPCAADADCGGGTCVGPDQGFAGGYCAAFGCSQRRPCPGGSDCFQVSDEQTACLATCQQRGDCREGYACEQGLACLPGCTADSCAAGEVCGEDGTCGAAPCTPASCAAGTTCGADGACHVELGRAPEGPIPNCDEVPTWECQGGEAHCGELVPFEPVHGPGYWNYPINGETEANQYRSFTRRDTQLLVKYAAAKVECLASGWAIGNHQPQGLGDMSEANGDIPGTSIGQPGHPAGTHVNGFDMDIAYYQVNTPDNRLRPICEHTQGGQDQYHCTQPPNLLDPWRSALFIAFLHHSPQLRVIGVDGQAGEMITAATTALCAAGWVDGAGCSARSRALTYEVQDEGRGWFQFHHHHIHVSLTTRGNAGLGASPARRALCLSPDCTAFERPGGALQRPRIERSPPALRAPR